MQIAPLHEETQAVKLANPFAPEHKAVITEQLTYLQHLFTGLSQEAMATKSVTAKAELLRTALLAQTNYVKTFKLLMELKKEGEKPAVHILEDWR